MKTSYKLFIVDAFLYFWKKNLRTFYFSDDTKISVLVVIKNLLKIVNVSLPNR